MNKQLENISLDDSVLVRKCQQGDSEAMGRLIVKYQDRIFNVIIKICHNFDDAVELTQETFVKAIEKIETFQGRSQFYTWLFRIAVNLTLNYQKRKFKLNTFSLDAQSGFASDESRGKLRDFLADKGELDPALIVQNKEIGQLVIASLGKLDENQHIILVLRDIEGMAYAEIAQTLDIELGTVKSRLSRARANLKEILEIVLS